jgi:surfeit locus 1 family protein
MMDSKPRSLAVPIVATSIAFAFLVSLGVWQLSRKQWKEALIDNMTARFLAAPVTLPSQDKWPSMSAENSEFLRVKIDADFWPTRDAYAYVAGSALRDDIKSPGYFVFRPAKLPDGRIVVVNRGYVPIDNTEQSKSGSVELTGYLRWPEPKSMFVSSSDSSGETWFVRDQRAMAEARDWGEVAPFYIDQEAPAPEGGLPRPSKLQVTLRNDHFGYALTWFGLAAVLAGVFAVWLFGQRRKIAQPAE